METKQILEVRCGMCDTGVVLDVIEQGLSIISTDQAAQFIQIPRYICGKCHSECTVNLKETP